MYSKGMEDRVNFVESGYTTKAGFKLERGNVLENRKIEHAEITLQESLNDAEKSIFQIIWYIFYLIKFCLLLDWI